MRPFCAPLLTLQIAAAAKTVAVLGIKTDAQVSHVSLPAACAMSAHRLACCASSAAAACMLRQGRLFDRT